MAVSATAKVGESARRSQLSGLRLTRRGKVVLVLLCLCVVGGALGLSVWVMTAPSPHGLTAEVATVEAGQALWDFAAQVAVANDDVRNVGAEIYDFNGMSDDFLIAGQRLLLPMRQSLG